MAILTPEELNFSNKNIVMILSGLPGVGKEQPLSSLVLTPDGFKTMGDIAVGDSVIGGDGEICTVTGVFPQGIKPVYRVTFSDGMSARCGLDHIWTVQASSGNSRKCGWKNHTLRELAHKGIMIDSPSRAATGRKALLRWQIPLVSPINYPEKELEVDPYLLGVLIGDGCMTGSTVLFSNPDIDSDIRLQIEKILPDNYILSKHDNPSCPQYVIKQKHIGGKDGFLKKISALNLDVHSRNKFIPAPYMLGSYEQRLALLRGLMDTDGSARANRVSYSTISCALACCVSELIQSLGGIAKTHSYDRRDENKGIEYHVNVKLNVCPFSISRKANEWSNNTFGRYIESIDYMGHEECQCIMVSNDSGLYVTDNYIVTHNTTLALSAPDALLIDTDRGLARVNPAHRKASAQVNSYQELLSDIEQIKRGHKYTTLVIDTAGELIELMKLWALETEPTARKKNGGMSLPGYGIVKSEFLRLSADLRQQFNVIFIFHATREKSGDDITYELVCEGATRNTVWQPADLGAYLQIINGERFLGFTPTEQYSAKAAYGIKGLVRLPELKEGETNTFLTGLFQTVRKNLDSESTAYTEEKAKYDYIMNAGKELIKAVTGPEDIKLAAQEIDKLGAALTSKSELKSAMFARMKELGWIWDKKGQAWVATK